MTNFFLLNQIILNNKREDGSQSPYWDSLSVKVNLIIRMEIEGFEGREAGQLVSSPNWLSSLRSLVYVALGSQSMKQNVLLSQISLDHNKNNQATVIEEEKKKQSRGEKWLGCQRQKWMTDPDGLHYFSVGKVQQLPKLSSHFKCFTTQIHLINHFQATD